MNDLFENNLMYWPKGVSGLSHDIVEGEITDIAPTYNLADHHYAPLDWLPEGASGSMLIGEINNEWQVIAIYWGGMADFSLEQFLPMFSIFNSLDKNFIQPYI